MNLILPSALTTEEFLRWSQRQESGRYELEAGRVITMPGESVGHVFGKQQAYDALKTAIARAGIACFAMPDGIAVRIDAGRVYEPDALVAWLPAPASDALEIANPVIVVEVLSTWSIKRDLTTKVSGYTRVASIEHYLVIDPDEQTVLHFQRRDGLLVPPLDAVGSGTLQLDTPGLTVDVDALVGLDRSTEH